jgi:class 3 adenylate cyclase
VEAVSDPEWAMVSILFVDIRGYTTLADRQTSRFAADYLREFFDVVVPVVTEHAGEVNQILGDGLLAVFRTPDHADRAVSAGAAMVDAVRDRFRIGVGINSGLVLIGTMGGGGVTHFGLVGDPVNVAARVQDATRELGHELLLTAATRVLLDGGHPELVPCGSIELRGKSTPVDVYSVTLPGRPARRTDGDVGAH